MWTDDLTVGIWEIDTQHRALFAQLEKLLDACMVGRELDEVMEMIVFLDDYVTTHFDTEERLQRQGGYPDYDKHRAEHVIFRTNLERLKAELRESGATRDLVLRVNQVLIDWLKTHIRNVDAAMSEFLLKKTGQPADMRQ
ncbi:MULTISPECIES: hemerythrin family protein [Geobacter]|uniref:hemerythrin family protein n=1 Tax=Geobacter TaxID=28231 RepID=UPI0025744D33|nr:hemerythrin family protein [Geobacter sulfurreducens]BEH09382.1 hemerythrin family protein [Geobacter sulfurreducens subsp. ethanolicus]BET57264.1 hemerythrin family protein [Geobacter sp. 60473]HML79996.1 hemerythrin family protein [Geobacter sulfurreducens]